MSLDLIVAYAEAKRKRTTNEQPRAKIGDGLPLAGTPDDTAYGLAALRGECEDLAAMAPDSGRNSTLNKAAYRLAQLIASGHLTEATMRINLTAAARQSGLPTHEIDLVMRENSNGAITTGRAEPRHVQPLEPPPELATFTTNSDDQATPNQPEPAEHTSWWFRDLDGILDGTQTEPAPTHLTRTDGQNLFYAGKINGLLGESESGKTWVALLTVHQALQHGDRVLYLDFEDSAAGIVGRLRALGATPTELDLFAYIDPDETLHLAAKADLQGVLDAHQPALVVLDGFNAAMTLLGLDLQSNKDATTFAQALLRPLSKTTATVIYIDHLPKNREHQGKGGIGAQAKRAMTTGCALRVDVTAEFGRGMTGRLKLTVDKDRAGHVRANSGGAKNAGQAVLVSTADGNTVNMHVEAPDLRPIEERTDWRPTNLMEKVSRLLESLNEPLSSNAIEKNIPGDDKHVRKAVQALVDDGYINRSAGPRGAVLHHLIKPFRELEMPHLGDLGGPRWTSVATEVNDLGTSVATLGATEHRGQIEPHTQPDLGGTTEVDQDTPWWQR